jgi:hypothetical protein
MELNPCLECARKDMNKNDPICRDCDKRIEYVNRLALDLNYTASYSHDRLPVHGISLVSGGPSSLLLQKDALY